jgi:hypothetical protein
MKSYLSNYEMSEIFLYQFLIPMTNQMLLINLVEICKGMKSVLMAFFSISSKLLRTIKCELSICRNLWLNEKRFIVIFMHKFITPKKNEIQNFFCSFFRKTNSVLKVLNWWINSLDICLIARVTLFKLCSFSS